MQAFDRAQARMQLDVVDLYLIHWPVPSVGRYVEAWRALARLKTEGRVRAIGVSNFLSDHLYRIIDATGEVPVVNQVECHPSCQQASLREVHRELGIVSQAWSPLGNGQDLADPLICEIAEAHGTSPAQVILSWSIGQGVMPVVKASSAQHMQENLRARDLRLTEVEIWAIALLDQGVSCFGVDPRTFVAPPGFEDFHP